LAEMRSSPADTRRLEAFERLLRAQGFPTSLVLAGAQVPYDVLLAGLSDADETRQWQLELSFLPGMEEDLEGLSLLQCFVLLPGPGQHAGADQPDVEQMRERLRVTNRARRGPRVVDRLLMSSEHECTLGAKQLAPPRVPLRLG